jgi:hypothetical protein
MATTLEQIAASANLAAEFSAGVVELKRMVERLAAGVAELKAKPESPPCR